MEKLFKIGDEVKIINGSHYLNNGKAVPENAINVKILIRNVTDKGYIVARAATGPILGEVSESSLKNALENDAVIKPYAIKTLASTPLYQSASRNSGIIERLPAGLLLTIVNEKGGFGKIRMGTGWIDLAKVKKFK